MGVTLIAPLQFFRGEDGSARRNASDDWQLEEPAGARAAAAVAPAQAARGAGGNFDGPLFLQRAQGLLGRIDRAKAHLFRDLGTCRRVGPDSGPVSDGAQELLPHGRPVL